MPRAEQKRYTTEELLQKLTTGIKKQGVKPNLYGYKPHDKQILFHMSTALGRLYIGGNRSGKTYSSIAEDCWWLTGTHPYIDTPEPPIRGRVVTVDFTYGLEQIILPLFKSLLPSKYLKNGSWEDSYSKQFRTLTLTNESTVEFMSYEQETEKFAGTSRHFIHYDEEPPLHIFNECNARLVDTGGSYWISMTPVEGLTWTFEKIYEKAKTDPNIYVVEADMLDNPYITKEAAERYLAGLDEDERKAREHGTYVQLGGLVYKKFNEETHVIDPIDPKTIPSHWRIYMSLDHGFNNPTGCLWHAVSPENKIITFSELYEREWTLDQISTAIKAKEAEWGIHVDYRVGDPAIAQRSAHNGTSIQTEYAMRGIYIALANNNVETGVAKVQMYLNINPETQKPFRQITSNCSNFIHEMKRLRWKTFASKKMQADNNPTEKIHKKDDHLCDSDRYFHTFLPDLTPPQLGVEMAKEPPADMHGGKTKVYGGIDEVLAAMKKSEDNRVSTPTQWNTHESSDLTGLEYD
jgi:phage terminase large subunit-like protein